MKPKSHFCVNQHHSTYNYDILFIGTIMICTQNISNYIVFAKNNCTAIEKIYFRIFSVCAPPPPPPHPPVCYDAPVAEHVPLHSKSLCKNMARASGVANNMHPLSWGHKQKFFFLFFQLFFAKLICFLVYLATFLNVAYILNSKTKNWISETRKD